MSTLHAHCPFCGEVQLDPRSIEVDVAGRAARYGFTCPSCAVYVSRECCPHTVDLLVSLGVIPRRVPAEALEEHTGPRLTYDDLLDLCEALKGRTLLAVIAERELTS